MLARALWQPMQKYKRKEWSVAAGLSNGMIFPGRTYSFQSVTSTQTLIHMLSIQKACLGNSKISAFKIICWKYTVQYILGTLIIAGLCAVDN